jgi:hypothetical protein
MQKETIVFTGIFNHYTPINFNPYYVFTTSADYPKFIGKLSHYDLVNLEGEIEEKCQEGIKLTNVKWGSKNE